MGFMGFTDYRNGRSMKEKLSIAESLKEMDASSEMIWKATGLEL